jgi:hypothetical protein
MDSLVPVLVGALIAIAGGVIFRTLEASNQRRHWFRDQVRISAEQFLADAGEYLRISSARLAGSQPTPGSVESVETAIRIDMTRLQLVAPESVLVAAKDVTTGVEEALKAAKSVDASWMRTTAMDEKASAQSVAARAALAQANLELARFVEVVKHELR